MRKVLIKIILMLLLLCSISSYGQTDPLVYKNDSINKIVLQELNQIFFVVEEQRIEDSIKKEVLESHLLELKTTNNLQKEELLKQLKSL